MIWHETIQSLCSAEFSAHMRLASDARLFVHFLKQTPEFVSACEMVKRDGFESVMEAIGSLASVDFDQKFANPHDVALSAMFWLAVCSAPSRLDDVVLEVETVMNCLFLPRLLAAVEFARTYGSDDEAFPELKRLHDFDGIEIPVPADMDFELRLGVPIASVNDEPPGVELCYDEVFLASEAFAYKPGSLRVTPSHFTMMASQRVSDEDVHDVDNWDSPQAA